MVGPGGATIPRMPVLPLGSAALTQEERARIRYHLGYPNVQAYATFALGTPQAFEGLFAIDSAFDKVNMYALPTVRELMAKCDETEQQMFEFQPDLEVSKVCDIELRSDAQQRLRDQYDWWRNALANQLGVYCNPFDKRDNARASINATVMH